MAKLIIDQVVMTGTAFTYQLQPSEIYKLLTLDGYIASVKSRTGTWRRPYGHGTVSTNRIVCLACAI